MSILLMMGWSSFFQRTCFWTKILQFSRAPILRKACVLSYAILCYAVLRCTLAHCVLFWLPKSQSQTSFPEHRSICTHPSPFLLLRLIYPHQPGILLSLALSAQFILAFPVGIHVQRDVAAFIFASQDLRPRDGWREWLF